MDHTEIENKARELQLRIWHERTRLWPEPIPGPLDMLDPAIAASILDIDFEYREELGRFGSDREHFEVAGMIDRKVRKIAVSRKFPPETVRFTGAHEIGHWMLHPGKIMHRDRPIKGASVATASRSSEEREADYFAACFLVPRKLAIAAFQATFQTNSPLFLNDASAYWLCPSDPASLLEANAGSLDFPLAVASAKQFNRRTINPLAGQFRVSAMTMAIRLRELKLIQE